MNRLFRISLDTLLMSTIPILMWIVLGIIVNKDIANVFTITYPIQFVTSLLLAIFGIGPNVNAAKNKKERLVDSNIILGIIVGMTINILLCINVDRYLNLMSMQVNIYKNFCIYSFTLMYFQFILQMVCQKLYYINKNKKSNRISIIFNIFNVLMITLFSAVCKEQTITIFTTLIIDLIIVLIILIENVKFSIGKFEIIKNMKYVSNDIFDRLGMFLIYFLGWKNTLEFGNIYLVAINFETLITDAQWDMSYSIITAATIDSSKNELDYNKSIKNSYQLIGTLLTSTFIMGTLLYFYYRPAILLTAIFVGIQVVDLLLSPSVWIKKQYCQINYSPKFVTTNECIGKLVRIISSFLPTPFCTYIGQVFNMLYQFIMFNIILKNKYTFNNGMLGMRKKLIN